MMADYGTAGVWDHDGAPLDSAKLPLSPRLRARLARWCDRFQASFDREIDLEAFAAEGRAIAHAVKSELPDWSIAISMRPRRLVRSITARHRPTKSKSNDRAVPSPKDLAAARGLYVERSRRCTVRVDYRHHLWHC